MQTIIQKRITGVKMVEAFNKNGFIRYFETKKLTDPEALHYYDITVRHNECEDPKEKLNNALK